VGTRKGPRRLAAEELFEYAVKCLGARAYSTGDLKSKLVRRAANSGDVGPTIERLKDIGYLNDERFAENFAQARVDNDGFGKIRVLSDLRARRVAGEIADRAVERALEGKSEPELIDAWIDRRMPSIAAGGPVEDDRVLAGAYRRLRRAGFTSGAILTALKQRAARPESIEEPPEEDEEG
jgi:regulatory protein